jgi:hypothetical protein
MIFLEVSLSLGWMSRRDENVTLLVDSAFLQGVKKIFHAAEDIKELIDPYVNFSFAGQQVNPQKRTTTDNRSVRLLLRRSPRESFTRVHILNSIKNFDSVSR